MPVDIRGVTYFSAADVVRDIGISRQTLWRWRAEGRVPQGHRYRGKRLLFTAEELDAVRNYASTVEPIGEGSAGQLKLFSKPAKRGQ